MSYSICNSYQINNKPVSATVIDKLTYVPRVAFCGGKVIGQGGKVLEAPTQCKRIASIIAAIVFIPLTVVSFGLLLLKRCTDNKAKIAELLKRPPSTIPTPTKSLTPHFSSSITSTKAPSNKWEKIRGNAADGKSIDAILDPHVVARAKDLAEKLRHHFISFEDWHSMLASEKEDLARSKGAETSACNDLDQLIKALDEEYSLSQRLKCYEMEDRLPVSTLSQITGSNFLLSFPSKEEMPSVSRKAFYFGALQVMPSTYKTSVLDIIAGFLPPGTEGKVENIQDDTSLAYIKTIPPKSVQKKNSLFIDILHLHTPEEIKNLQLLQGLDEKYLAQAMSIPKVCQALDLTTLASTSKKASHQLPIGFTQEKAMALIDAILADTIPNLEPSDKDTLLTMAYSAIESESEREAALKKLWPIHSALSGDKPPENAHKLYPLYTAEKLQLIRKLNQKIFTGLNNSPHPELVLSNWLSMDTSMKFAFAKSFKLEVGGTFQDLVDAIDALVETLDQHCDFTKRENLLNKKIYLRSSPGFLSELLSPLELQ